jgi:hypothetical protein
MSYVDLGKYQFTTSPDYSGFNPGNLTSVLSLGALRVAYFELYRLTIDTSKIPASGGLPAIVQVTPVFSGASLTALSGAFPKPVTKGNTVAVGIATLAALTGANPAPTGVTLGANADHFGSVVSAPGSAPDAGPSSFLWLDPDAQQSSSALAVAMAGGSGAVLAAGQGFEISGLLATSSALAAVDVSGSVVVNAGATTLAASTAGPPTGSANDMQIGFGMGASDSAFTLSQPGWQSTIGPFPSKPQSGYFSAVGGASNLASVKGSPGTFTLAADAGSDGCYWSLATASLLQAAGGGAMAAEAFPFTLAIDGTTYDTEQTTPGVGYTYSLGQSPMYLNTGQNLQLFWASLDAVTFGQYAAQMNITAWFRYDPSVQP